MSETFRPSNRLNSTFNGWQLTTPSNTATTASTNTLSFAWFGNNINSTGTWDFAPLDEMQECEPERFNQWRNRIDTDPFYHRQQLQMNQVHDIWNSTAGTTTNFTFNVNGITMTSDLRLHPRLKSLFPSRISRFVSRLNRYLKFNRTAEEIQREKAEKKSWELVKDWLTDEEFAELTSKGEMEIQSKEDLETIYIVKKDPLATVQEIKNGDKVKSMCLISKESGLATGDSLLSKIMLLKTDEKQFKKIAVIRNSA